MDTTADLQFVGVALVDGRPLACTGCGNTFSLEVHKHLGVFETAPAWVACLSCSRGEDSTVITNGLVDAALAARTGRAKAADRDTFTAEWRGTTLEGELHPQFVLDDAVELAKVVKQQTTRDAKRWGRAKKREAKTRLKAVVGAVTGPAKEKAAGVKVAALTAAWTLQTGGAGAPPTSKPRRQRCTVKGCRGGMLTITTRLHSTTGKTQKAKVPCAVCRRATA